MDSQISKDITADNPAGYAKRQDYRTTKQTCSASVVQPAKPGNK